MTSEPGARVALVAGGTRGLGLALARRLAAGGDRVYVLGRGADARAPALAFARGVERVDLLAPGAAQAALARLLAREGRLDLLACAAGDLARGPLAAAGVEAVLAPWRSNVATALAAVEAARPALRAARGAVLLFGCAGAAELRGRRTIGAYAAAKSALVALARSLALEEGPHGVRVNVVSPGVVPHADAEDWTRADERAAGVPLGRVGRPEEVAEVGAWLLSADAAYVTGVNLDVAGGFPRWGP